LSGSDHTQWIDQALWYACILGEAGTVAILASRRIYKSLPVFSAYMVWTIVTDLIALIWYKSPHYLRVYTYEMPLDSLLQFGVILELLYSVLRPYRSSLRRGTMLGVALLIALIGCAVWPLAGFTSLGKLAAPYGLLYHVLHTASILRILVFVVLASCSQLLGIGWKDRELQIATGLGLYSLVGFAVAVLQAHAEEIPRFHLMTQFVAGSYLCSLIYWIVCFRQQEAPRQEFSPRMQNVLLRVAGAAQANRLALEDYRKSGKS
jgi:hypothetical protein